MSEIHFDGDELDQVEEAVSRLLAERRTFFLSTSGPDAPWGAAAFFAESGVFNLSLVLELHGTTLRNIRHNSTVAMVVSSGDPFEPFLQGTATAEVLEDEEALRATADRLRAKAPQIEPLLGIPMAAIRLHVHQWRVTDVVKGWLPGKELTAPVSLSR